MTLNAFNDDKKGDDSKPKEKVCEPKFMYTLDTNKVPQVSQMAIEFINAVSGGLVSSEQLMVDLKNKVPIQVPGIDLKPQEWDSVITQFFVKGIPPPGYDKLKMPEEFASPKKDNKDGPGFPGTSATDQFAIGEVTVDEGLGVFHDGSLE
jgi:hypothetical protein